LERLEVLYQGTRAVEEKARHLGSSAKREFQPIYCIACGGSESPLRIYARVDFVETSKAPRCEHIRDGEGR